MRKEGPFGVSKGKDIIKRFWNPRRARTYIMDYDDEPCSGLDIEERYPAFEIVGDVHCVVCGKVIDWDEWAEQWGREKDVDIFRNGGPTDWQLVDMAQCCGCGELVCLSCCKREDRMTECIRCLEESQ